MNPENSSNLEKKSLRSREVTLKLTVTKRGFVVSSIVVLLIIGGVYLYAAGFIGQWYESYEQASASVVIKNIETKEPIKDAIVLIDKKMILTNQAGEAQISGLVAGKRTIQITKNGFIKYSKTINLARGKNNLSEIKLAVSPLEKITIKSFVKDQIANLPISQAKVTLDTKNTESDDSGIFEFTDMTTGKYLITIKKDGYKDFSQEINLDRQSAEHEYHLTADKKVYFMSNRDGKNGIYTADLDGKNPLRIVPKSDKGEESSLNISPNYKYAYFDSYREGVKDKNNNKVYFGYILDLATNKFTKISSDRFPSQVKWSDDSGYLVYQAAKDEADPKPTVLNVYNVAKAENHTLWQGNGYFSSIYFAGLKHVLVTISKYNVNDATTLEGLVSYDLENQSGTPVLMDKPYSFQEDILNNKLYFQVYRDSLKYEYDTEKLEIKEIKEIPDDLKSYVFSPNGRQMIFTDTRDGKTDIYLRYPNKDDEKKITTSGTASAPAWLDDSTIVYYENKPGEIGLWAASTLGGSGQKITDATLPTANYGDGY
ncbi:MAG: hypothetical protein UT11_C0052G0005 [Berkelbacteria bacterium GW2011_GWA2_38_9]|uniref:PEGA domain-containing protein n=1 Tax=Berkelbacteria bacterium GW2011_GWA2_38_9 TaxID=1618334 RepID=A0A0G0L8Y2_9BACT|nr:MAG: hypothetical protein UT11_C0052G0005 [Berkelbacteria bacterium GW2011_GWA2_38_9]